MREAAIDPAAGGVSAVVALVTRQARQECAPGVCAVYLELEACAWDAVTALWNGRVKHYVPLLALRRVRCCIRAGHCDGGDD